MTLYDYIDEQSVASLKKNTQLELAYLKDLLRDSLNDCKKLNNWLEDFNSLNNSSITFEESGFTYSIETRQRQEDETNRMADVLLSLARHYDQVSSVLKVCQSQSEDEFNIDISVLEKDTDEIPSVLEDLEESLQMIEAISEDVKIRNQLYASVQNELVNLLTKIDECSSEISKIVENIKSTKLEFSRRRSSLEGFSDELYNLVAWYHEFSSSYHHLVIEIDRRHRVEKYHQEIAEDYSKALQELHLAEERERHLFFEQYGPYLPMDLCPSIAELPVLYEIRPDALSNLPDISAKSVKEAITRLSNEQQS
ncbi:hypothetical protein K493DRAFT_341673 [Basidiobolus meristosporus CBS 931.73]|uniref:Autophagy-related protein 17 n=1 Tax=Basidiobolus meristosporus CBS 931.73 TaxID=1314790 RepID=A0A1Y1XK79_9FUNG|nr:hypothetical protein K493DRAFT_341673 [Basidiobolus meristosporus CBS 931.73]|eukprot:ORX86161.1 hypothetical protein K493DRAFT_341673 [Basidiobolus meristosporus CBS 931.73]